MNASILGLVLATIAGLSTTIGSAVVFCLDSYNLLPFTVCMAASAGVMVYISFIELFSTAHNSFLETYKDMDDVASAQSWAYCLTTTAFIAGWVLTSLFNNLCRFSFVQHCQGPTLCKRSSALALSEDVTSKSSLHSSNSLTHLHQKPATLQMNSPHPDSINPFDNFNEKDNDPLRIKKEKYKDSSDSLSLSLNSALDRSFIHQPSTQRNDSEKSLHAVLISPRFTSKELVACTAQEENQLDVNVETIPTYNQGNSVNVIPCEESGSDADKISSNKNAAICNMKLKPLLKAVLLRSNTTESDAKAIAFAEVRFRKEHQNFTRLGLFTAIALAIHNFPEGIATFTGTLANPVFGIAIAIAISLHNIPEGFAVAVPIYYGTGSQWKGFWYSFVSGLMEPVGAVVTFFALGSSNVNSTFFGWVVGGVAGIMANISLAELYPTALQYDPVNKVTTLMFFVAMALMAMSLIAIRFFERP